MHRGKSAGPFSVPTHILKDYGELLVNPLHCIINKSLREGIFPALLKSARICPIFKKGDKMNCGNYRPISLLSNLSKIFERIYFNQLEHFLNVNDLIYNLQFGFRKKYSTNHALLSIVEQIRHNLDNGSFACGVFVDLEKAFDTVNHKILLSKLDHYGIRGRANEWVKSYLSNRDQFVNLNNCTSSKNSIKCGVPQGSILGPLLFIIYINDMNKAIANCVTHHFADDTNLLYAHKDPNVIRKVVNKDLDLLFQWLCANRLSLNVSKTEFIIFRPPKKNLSDRIVLTLNNTKIFESLKIKYLGLLMDTRLNWKAHIHELSKKLSQAIGMIYKIRQSCNHQVLLSLYHAIFNSHMTYGLPIWGNATDNILQRIVILQKKAIRAISHSGYNEHSSPIFKDLNILKLKDQYDYQLASLLWDLDHDTLPASLVTYFSKINKTHTHETRQATSNKYRVNRANTLYGKNSFQIQGSELLNKLKNTDIYNNAWSKSNFLNN